MKKVFISMALMLAAGTSFAQVSALKEADKAVGGGNYAQIDQMVEQALQDPTAASSAEAWNMAGKIYQKISSKQMEQQVLQRPFDTLAFYNAPVNMYKYFSKADELAQQPDAKGKVKNKYRSSMANALKSERGNLINGGIYYFNQNTEATNKKALEMFGTYVDMADSPMMEKENYAVNDTNLSLIAYYASLAALRVNDYNNVQKYAQVAMNDKENGETAAELLIESYKQLKQNDKYVKAIQESIAKYPTNTTFFANLVDYYTNNNQLDEAMSYTDRMIAQNPDNYFYPYVKGYLYTNEKDYDNAIECYKKAVSLKDDFADAYSRLGLIYVIKAQDFSAEATTDVNDPKYTDDQQTLRSFFEAARPYLEKCRQLSPDNRSLWYQGLNSVYYNLHMQDEYDALQQQ